MLNFILTARENFPSVSRACRFALASVILMLASARGASDERPNILLIFADDLGWKELGYQQGGALHETPNIDRLAREGMVFSNGYAGAGNCAPSRACLLSGQYTPRHEVYAVGTTDRGPDALKRMVPIPNRQSLSPENITVAGALKSAGYVTGIFGKWHLVHGKNTLPGDQGFDVVHESKHGWGGAGSENDNPKGIYSLTDGVVDFMQKNRDRPFFAYLAHYAVHTGYQARPATLAKFKAKPADQRHSNPLYAACLNDLDDGVGILLRKLSELNLDRKTLVVFTSDNGSNFAAEPLRGKKGCYYENGIREPFIVRWTGTVKPGTRCDIPVINQDLYPTFLAVAGAKPPPGKILDGESLVPLFRETGSLRRQAIFWHFPGYLDGPVPRGRDAVFRTRPVSVIRKGDWKLHLFHEEWQLDGGRERLATNNAVELYHMRDDIGETKNLASANLERRDELLNDLLRWFKAVDAKLPTEKHAAYAPGTVPAKKKKSASE